MKLKVLPLFLILAVTACKPAVIEVVEESWEDGSPRLMKYFNKQIDSLSLLREVAYYPNGITRIDGSFLEGQRHGYWVYYYDNGNKWSEGHYLNGLEDQMRRVWYPDGKLNYEGMFHLGKRIGKWKFWDETGILIQEIDYSPAE